MGRLRRRKTGGIRTSSRAKRGCQEPVEHDSHGLLERSKRRTTPRTKRWQPARRKCITKASALEALALATTGGASARYLVGSTGAHSREPQTTLPCRPDR